MSEEQVITISPEEAKLLREESNKRIDISNALIRLTNNPDFKLVFLDEYCTNEPVRLVKLLGEPSFNFNDKKKEYREDLQERMIGIARFDEFMRNIHKTAERAEKTLQDLADSGC